MLKPSNTENNQCIRDADIWIQAEEDYRTENENENAACIYITLPVTATIMYQIFWHKTNLGRNHPTVLWQYFINSNTTTKDIISTTPTNSQSASQYSEIQVHMVGPEAAWILDPNILKAFSFALEVNYHLQQITLLSMVQNQWFAPQVQYQCHVNQHRWQRWIQHQYNNTNHPCCAFSSMETCPVTLLSQVSNDLDGLYYY